MQATKHALVLTGGLLPGLDAEAVWLALAAYLSLSPEQFESQFLARAPITIKESDDTAKLQAMQAGAHAAGAEAGIYPLDDSPGLFVLIDNLTRGPVPHSFIVERIRRGTWPEGIRTAEAGAAEWTPLVPQAPVPVFPDAPPPRPWYRRPAVIPVAAIALVCLLAAFLLIGGGPLGASLCDTLAASPLDPTRPAGVTGVESAKVDGARALEACLPIAERSDDPRV